MGSASDWHSFLDEFRSFGGKAENVMQRKGAYGLGLFPIDPSKPVDLFVPDSLLVATDNVEIRNGKVEIIDQTNLPEGYSDWFQRYQAAYSWGAEGRENTLAVEEGLKALPKEVLIRLKRHGLYNPDNRFPGEDIDKEIFERFVSTRCIRRKDRRVIMPMIELLNHSPSAKAYDMSGDGIAVGGLHDGEILVKYSISEPLRRLIAYGFNSPEPMAFSLSLAIQHRGKQIVIRGGGGVAPLKPCKVEKLDDKVIIKQPLLASSSNPKMPKTLLIKSTKGIENLDSSELFEQIHQRNTQILIEIIKELQEHDSEMGHKLKIACLDQLEALSHHYGQRDDLLEDVSS